MTTIPDDLHAALKDFAAAPRILVACDFDGTLSEIVDNPADARPVPGAMDAVHALRDLPDTETALVSGRGLADLRQLSGAQPGVHLIASHGAEFDEGVPGSSPAAEIDEQLRQTVRQTLEAAAALDPGLEIETKAAGFAFHYRRAHDQATAERAVHQILTGPASLEGVRVKEGKCVIELSLVDASKGVALPRVAKALKADRTLFVGDDITDEEAFKTLDDNAITIKVGEGNTAARYRIDAPTNVVHMLNTLATLRRDR